MVRFKNRYLLFELSWEDGKVDESVASVDLFRAIRESVQVNFGDMAAGSLMTSLNMKYFNCLTNLCILRSSRDNHALVRASAALVKSVRGRVVCFTCRHVAGTIRSCQEAAIRLHQQSLAQLIAAATTAPEVRAAAEAAIASPEASLEALTKMAE